MENLDQNKNMQLCNDTSDCVELSAQAGLFLKPIARLNITVTLPQLKSGQSISNWEVMEKLRAAIAPEKFTVIKVTESTGALKFIKFDAEIENKKKLNFVITRIDKKGIKLSGLTDLLKIHAVEAKIPFPSRHDWDSFFRDAKHMNEMKPGERPDTVYLEDLPCAWFMLNNAGKPSEYGLRKIFETFGEIRAVDIPFSDPHRHQMSSSVSGINLGTFSFKDANLFDAYIQFKEYIGFAKCMHELQGKKLVFKGDKTWNCNIKVDFDKTRHLSEKAFKKRLEEKEKLVLAEREKEIQNRRAKHLESMKEESERMAQEESLRAKKEEKLQKKQDKEKRRKQREMKRRMKKMQSKDDPEKEEKAIASIEDKMSKKIALEERKLLIAQRKLESIRLLDALFDRIKINHRKEVLTLRAMEGGSYPEVIDKKEETLSNTEWFNDDCKSSDRLRKFYRARFQKAPKDLNAKAMYLNAKKKYKSVCKIAKKSFFELRKKEEDDDNDMVTKEKKLREKLINSLKRQQQEAMVHQQKRVEKVIQGKILDKSEVGSNDGEEDNKLAGNNVFDDSDSDSSLSSSDSLESSIPEDCEKLENKPTFPPIQGPMGMEHMNGPPPGFFPPNGPPMEWGPMPPMPPPFMNNDPFSPNFEPPFNGPPNFFPGSDGMQFMQRGRGNMNMRMQRGFRGMPFNPFFRGRGQWDHMNRRNFNQRGRWVNRGRGKDNMAGKKQQQEQPVETKWFRRDKAYQERRSFKPDRSSSSGSRSRSRHRTRSWSASRSRTRSQSRSSRRWSSKSRSRSRRRTRSRSHSRKRSERSRSRSHKSGSERMSRSKSQSKKKSRSRSGSKKREVNENKEEKDKKSRSGSREKVKSRSRSGSGSRKSRSYSRSRSRSRSSRGRSRHRSRSRRRSRSSRGRSRSSRGRSRSSRGRSRSSRRRSRSKSKSRSRSHSRRRSSHHKKRGRKNDYDSEFEISSEEKWFEEYPPFGEEFYPNPNFMPFQPHFQNFQHPNQDFRGRGRGGRFQNNQHQQWNWRGRRPNRNNRGNWRGRNQQQHQQQHQQGGRGFQPPNYYNPHYADMPYEEDEPPEEENVDMAEEYHDLYRKYFTSIAEKEASNRRKQSKGKDDKEVNSEDEKTSVRGRNNKEKSDERILSPKRVKLKKKEKPATEEAPREEPKAFKRSYSNYRSKDDKDDSEIEATPKKGKSKTDKTVDQEYQSKEQQARYEIMSRLSKRPMEESDSEREDFLRKESVSTNKRSRKHSEMDDHDIEWIGSDKDDDGKLYSDRHSERNLKERLSSSGSRRSQGFRNFRSRGRGNFENRQDFRENRRGRGVFINFHERKLYDKRGSPPDMRRKTSPYAARKEMSPSDRRKGNFADRKRHYSSPDSRKGDFDKERDHTLDKSKIRGKLRKQSRDSSERDYSSEREYGQRKRDFERETDEKKKLQVFELETRYREEEERIRAQAERDKMRDRSLELKSRRNIRKRQIDSDDEEEYRTDRRSFKKRNLDLPNKEIFDDRSSEERVIKHKKKIKSDENIDDRTKIKLKKKKKRE